MMKIIVGGFLVFFICSCKGEKSTEQDYSPLKETSEITEFNDTLNELLKVKNPRPGQLIASPFEITGEARGYWFFEAQAAAELLDENLQHISQTNTTAIGEWMTEDWVPFSGTMIFEKPSTDNGFLVLHKANASGLKEHAMSDTIKVRFRRKINTD